MYGLHYCQSYDFLPLASLETKALQNRYFGTIIAMLVIVYSL